MRSGFLAEPGSCLQVCPPHLAEVLGGCLSGSSLPSQLAVTGVESGLMVLLKELQDSGTAGGLRCAVKLAHDLLSNLFCRLESITNLFILLLQKSCLNV